MPTYEYVCQHCGHEFEELQLINEPPLEHCPNCNTDSLLRVMGGGGGLIFKGSGFYLTDYKAGKTSTGPETKKETPSEKKDATPPPAGTSTAPKKE